LNFGPDDVTLLIVKEDSTSWVVLTTICMPLRE